MLNGARRNAGQRALARRAICRAQGRGSPLARITRHKSLERGRLRHLQGGKVLVGQGGGTPKAGAWSPLLDHASQIARIAEKLYLILPSWEKGFIRLSSR